MNAVNNAHELEYNVKPDVVARAPGRFHLAGEHSWYFKDKTLSMAVNLPVYVAVSKRDDSNLHFHFVQLKDRKKSTLTALKFKKEDKWANAIKAMIYGFTSGGFDLGGMDITVYTDILPSAGFGITTAIKAATAVAVRRLFNLHCSDVEMLQVIERGNKRFLQQENYIADNYSALFSKKGNLLVTDHFKNSWDYVAYPFEDKKIFLIDTKVPRINVWNEDSIHEPQYVLILGDLRDRKPNVYGGWQYISNITDIKEVMSELGEDLYRRLFAIMKEHNDVLEARDGLEKNDFFKFARAVNDSHQTMRELFSISCPEIDWIIKRVNELEPNLAIITNPVTCARITGKGFGRCLYAIMRESDVETFKSKLNEFEKIFGFHPSCYEVETADGAAVIKD